MVGDFCCYQACFFVTYRPILTSMELLRCFTLHVYCSTRAICSSSFSISAFIRGETFIDKIGSPWAVRLRLEEEEV